MDVHERHLLTERIDALEAVEWLVREFAEADAPGPIEAWQEAFRMVLADLDQRLQRLEATK